MDGGDTRSKSKIQLEQIQILKTAKILSQLLTKINENINSLTVEELQLKANAIVTDIEPKLKEPSSDLIREFKTEQNLSENAEEINKQNLFLDVFGYPMTDQEEYDSS